MMPRNTVDTPVEKYSQDSVEAEQKPDTTISNIGKTTIESSHLPHEQHSSSGGAFLDAEDDKYFANNPGVFRGLDDDIGVNSEARLRVDS